MGHHTGAQMCYWPCSGVLDGVLSSRHWSTSRNEISW